MNHQQTIHTTLDQLGQQSAIASFAQPHAHLMMTQMNIREGIQIFRYKGIDALIKELNQQMVGRKWDI